MPVNKELKRGDVSGLLSFLALCAALLAGCRLTGSAETRVEGSYDTAEASRVVFFVSGGDVTVRQGGSTVVVRTAESQPMEIVEGTDLQFVRRDRREESPVEVWIPPVMDLQVETDRGSILLYGLSTNLEAHSLSGDILAEDCSGVIQVRAQRGDAMVSGGSGELRVVGDHGVLTAARFRGSVSMSTIMGTLVYEGPPAAADNVKLETDHGPVQVLLPVDASMRVVVTTTSGRATCMAGELRQTYNGCEGVLGDGDGSLSVRTVSGTVDIRVTPAIMEVQND